MIVKHKIRTRDVNDWMEQRMEFLDDLYGDGVQNIEKIVMVRM